MAIADLSVTKSASPSPVGIGQPLTYTISVNNAGPDIPTSAAMQDTIPSGVCITSITASQGSYCYENGTVTWTIGALNLAQTVTMTIVVMPQTAGTIGNTATVYFTDPIDVDPNPNNNSSTINVEVTPSVDLLILKESCPAQSIVGAPISYNITVVNNGPSSANNVVVTDTLPSGVTVQSVQLSQGTYSQSGNVITFSLGTIDVNDIATIGISITAGSAGDIKNTAVVSSEEPDINPNNNTAEVVTTVNPAADISITKTASADEVQIGDVITYIVTIKNNGPSAATNIIAVDTLPTTVNVISINVSQGTYIISGNVINYNVGTLLPGNAATMEIKVRAAQKGMIINSATGSAFEADPNPCNNNDSVYTFVTKSAGTDISVEKTHCPEPAGICSPVLYTIIVRNNGPISATGITLVDKLPPSLEILSINSSQGRCCICADKGCKVSCRGQKEEKHKEDNIDLKNINVKYYSSDFSGMVILDHDECNDNSTDNLCNKENCRENLCNSSKEIICQLGALANGEEALVKILVRPKLIGNIENTAIVTSNEFDLDPSNNQVTDTLLVIPVCEQIDQLINLVNIMITDGTISDENGQMLIKLLDKAKMSLCCGSSNSCCFRNTNEANEIIKTFIQKVKFLIMQNIISEENGCKIIKTAEGILDSICCDYK